ncbi:MAG: UbiX family flavin prenyltransferase [Desulfobacteraceae bacterium]|nr:MAG: UbiX family flavin prenyltransferase [Desulfobacteraceae bacterium]
MELNRKQIVVAITGASGSIYGVRLIKSLMTLPVKVYLVVSPSGRQVMMHETGYAEGPLDPFLREKGAIFHESAMIDELSPDDFSAPIASGSFQHDGMVVAPCSMNTLAAIANGITDNGIHRAADVCLKERRPLILLPRETPLSLIHLKNMVRAAEAGAVIMPPSPGFYHRPQTIDDLVDTVVARILDHLGLAHDLSPRWGG